MFDLPSRKEASSCFQDDGGGFCFTLCTVQHLIKVSCGCVCGVRTWLHPDSHRHCPLYTVNLCYLRRLEHYKGGVCPALIPLCVVKMPPNLWLLDRGAKQSVWLNCCPDHRRSSACFAISQCAVHCGLNSLFVLFFCHFNPSVIHVFHFLLLCFMQHVIRPHTFLVEPFPNGCHFCLHCNTEVLFRIRCYLEHNFISVINFNVESVHLKLSILGYLCSLWS